MDKTSILALLLLLFTPTLSTPFPDHFIKSSSLTEPHSPPKNDTPQEYLEITLPSPSDRWVPSCTHPIIHHSFANTINKPPFSTPYTPPPNCPPPWAHVTLHFHVTSKGDQYDRISGLWLGGAELLRTSTAEPTETGIYWSVKKDITRYTSLLVQENLNLTIKLENLVNNVYTGIYHVKVTLYFHKYDAVNLPFPNPNPRHLRTLYSKGPFKTGYSLYEQPADLVIPISSTNGNQEGYWFVLDGEKDVRLNTVRFPQNTIRASLELYLSFHGNDEFWYSNPPDSYIKANNLTTGRGGGSYREVCVTLDGMLVGSEVPFPVIFAGGINPLSWAPVVAIGAFNLPSYDFDLTPFLGTGLLDGRDHVIGVGVSESISYWLVDLNLHVWLDYGSSNLEAKMVILQNPRTVIKRREEFKSLNGTFILRARRGSSVVGWVKSSLGNLTTSISHELYFRNSIIFKNNGTLKSVTQKMRTRNEVKVINDVGEMINRVVVRRTFPLKVFTEILPSTLNETDAYMLRTNVSHTWVEKWLGSNGESRGVHNRQTSAGWMEVLDHDVLGGEAKLNQTYIFRDEESGCYVRSVAAVNGSLASDITSYACPSIM